MFSRRKIAAVSGLVGGIAVACAGITQAHAAATPGNCTRDLLGTITCTQRIKGEAPDDGAIAHQETCQPVQPLKLPAFLGQGTERLGPNVTCSPTTVGVPPDSEREAPDGSALGPMARILPVEGS
ncbi:hypothetical protein [Streptomyces broussonetiae]|uniref:hypothetical protein n=1 Tax=Streptomyces broussonetiae TaxID=2686304 RepID=UPI0035E0750C